MLGLKLFHVSIWGPSSQSMSNELQYMLFETEPVTYMVHVHILSYST